MLLTKIMQNTANHAIKSCIQNGAGTITNHFKKLVILTLLLLPLDQFKQSIDAGLAVPQPPVSKPC